MKNHIHLDLTTVLGTVVHSHMGVDCKVTKVQLLGDKNKYVIKIDMYSNVRYGQCLKCDNVGVRLGNGS